MSEIPKDEEKKIRPYNMEFNMPIRPFYNKESGEYILKIANISVEKFIHENLCDMLKPFIEGIAERDLEADHEILFTFKEVLKPVEEEDDNDEN